MRDGKHDRAAGAGTIRLVHGDITAIEADAIVNAANELLAPGGGVSGAIHRAGGPEITREAGAIGHCPTGDAVVTTAGTLPARFVVHAVAPIWHGGDQNEPELLRSAYRRSLEEADTVGAQSVAFPSLGTGIYGYPVSQAARVAIRTVDSYLRTANTNIHDVIFVLFSESDFTTYAKALAVLDRG